MNEIEKLGFVKNGYVINGFRPHFTMVMIFFFSSELIFGAIKLFVYH